MYFTSDVTEDQKAKRDEPIHKPLAKLRGKSKAKRKEALQEAETRAKLFNDATEKLGVGIIVNTHKIPVEASNVKQINARMMSITIDTRPMAFTIRNCHATHADSTAIDKDRFFHTLEVQFESIPSHLHAIVLGDFNARLVECLDQEKDIVGEHFYKPLGQALGSLSEAQMDNRSRLLERCKMHRLILSNTWLEKPNHELITYRPPEVPRFGVDNSSNNYAQLDYILVRRSWRNTVSDICTYTNMLIESDHGLVAGSFACKLAAGTHGTRSAKSPQFLTPSHDQIDEYNLCVAA